MRIVISGTVGVGKSTVTNILSSKLKDYDSKAKINTIKEDTVESIYLQDYYDNPQEWAFIAQLDFLFERFKNWLKDEKYRQAHQNEVIYTLYDRHFIDDYIFAELHSIKENISNINSVAYQTIYQQILDKMRDFKAEPEIFFLLKAPIDVVIERFRTRNRLEESEVDMEYWKQLYHNYYERPLFKNHFAKNAKYVILINTENKTPSQIADEMIEHINLVKNKK